MAKAGLPFPKPKPFPLGKGGKVRPTNAANFFAGVAGAGAAAADIERRLQKQFGAKRGRTLAREINAAPIRKKVVARGPNKGQVRAGAGARSH